MIKHIVFTTLAENQTEFFVGVGQALQKKGLRVSLISFHEPSMPRIRAAGLSGVNIFEEIRRQDGTSRGGRFAKIVKELDLATPMTLTVHERYGFEVEDEHLVERKFASYYDSLKVAFTTLGVTPQDTVVIQETGGFTSLLATYFLARKQSVEHYFVEPSFFRETVFFTRNSLEAPKVNEISKNLVSPEVEEYLNATVKSRAIVIPKKDAWQYAGVFGKLMKPRNFRRLTEKLLSKYLRDQREEFSYIGAYVGRHFNMMVNRVRFSRDYSEIPDGPFIYYPLHVPMDVALTVRSPEYLDQYATIDFMARSLPPGYKLAIKEHPALVGAIDGYRMRKLLAAYPEIRLLRPNFNNFEVLSRTDAVITVNSKAGAEAVLMEKPVVVLGDAFYRNAPVVQRANSLTELGEIISRRRFQKPSRDMAGRYFQAVWEKSYPGEIYQSTEQNFAIFSESIQSALARNSESPDRISSSGKGTGRASGWSLEQSEKESEGSGGV